MPMKQIKPLLALVGFLALTLLAVFIVGAAIWGKNMPEYAWAAVAAWVAAVALMVGWYFRQGK